MYIPGALRSHTVRPPLRQRRSHALDTGWAECEPRRSPWRGIWRRRVRRRGLRPRGSWRRRDAGSSRAERDFRAGLFLAGRRFARRSEEHTSELQSQSNLVCRLLLEKKKKKKNKN